MSLPFLLSSLSGICSVLINSACIASWNSWSVGSSDICKSKPNLFIKPVIGIDSIAITSSPKHGKAGRGKMGGGLITDKTVLLTPNLEVIQNLSRQVKNVVEAGYQVILVHGAGSFGHLRAKHWKLHLGKQDEEFMPEPGIFTQEQAVEEVRRDMESLNSFVLSNLQELNLDCEVFPAHKWATETGSNFEGNLSIFENSNADVIITFGDVVDCSAPEIFGILSGDDLVKRLSIEIDDVERLVFAIGGVDGVLENPPGDGKEIVIPTLTRNSNSWVHMNLPSMLQEGLT